MAVQEALSFNDLFGLNSSPESVREAFKNNYGENPDGIAVNNETYFNAVTPAITQRYGHPCYKTLGEFDYAEKPNQAPREAVVGTNYAVNNSDEEATISLTVDAQWSETQSWSTSITAGMSFSAEFTMEGVFKAGASFSVSTTAGKSGSHTTSQTSSATVSVTVPAKSKKEVKMVATMQEEEMSFTAPIAVQGMFGANFPDRVQGHYFWFLDAGTVLNKTSGELTGTIKNTSALHVQTHIGASEPL